MTPCKELSVQTFKSSWLNMPGLKEWLQEKKHSQGHSVAYCKDCICNPNSNKLWDLKHHVKTKKHFKNARDQMWQNKTMRINLLNFSKILRMGG